MSAFSRWSRFYLQSTLLAALSASACAEVDEDPAEPTPPLYAAQELAAAPRLGPGRREVLVEGLVSVENQLFLNDDLLLVSGDEGLFAVTRDAATQRFSAKNLKPGQPCKFSGIAVLGEAVYAGCYDGSRSHLYASPRASLEFVDAGEIKGVGLANGLVSDARQHLYVSATGGAKIVELSFAPGAPLRIGSQRDWPTPSGGLLPNALDIHAGVLYWSDIGSLRKQPLARNAWLAPLPFVSQLTFFDDMHVDDDGVLIADYLFNRVLAFDLRGRGLGATDAVFKSPSSVLPARGRLGLGADDLLITEKGANLISVYRPGR
jgi:hypothetical protein